MHFIVDAVSSSDNMASKDEWRGRDVLQSCVA